MNAWLVAASLAAFATFLVHTFVGGRQIAAPLLQARSLARIPRLTVYYCWHMVTLLLLAMAAALGWAAYQANVALVLLVLALSAGFAGLSLALVVRFRVSAWLMPQWSFFVVIALLSAAGLA
ncbi:hypothetical protein DFR29_111124 [Tahibacter aquaticus]|uniref:DUF3325 domain-containing protein n=1 Tax=Tahibacter aquaticus TaxID=520092 RepID=A0A4R6YSZ6_9GAMM|nr:hypothetical protein [Tahibacter aquaticus]TDR41212.1 hypothetical protein DFR29_111124 [Tahibacter aquaticus]